MTALRVITNAFAVCVWLLTLINQTFGQSECSEEQKLSLLQFKGGLKYNSEYSTKITQWNQTTDCCRWPGVSCDSLGAVAALDLSDESIVDGLDHSAALTTLTSLQSLNLSRNLFITQKIPSFIHKLTALTELNLGSTNLSGPINDSLINLRFLSKLRLDGNFFLTPIPLFLANFTNMKWLILNNSFWIGEFPEAIFHMKSIQVISVKENKELRGKLPEFHSNSSLEQMVVTGTKFGGIIPTSVGNLPILWNLKLGECQFTGEIPRSLFNLSAMVILELQKNNLTGFVDLDWIINLTNLGSFSLSDNFLTVKANSLRLDQLIILDLQHCNMKNFPFLSNQSELLLLSLVGNHIEGSIPSSLPTTLFMLDLSENNFTSIPADGIGKLESLDFLSLSHNDLHGNIPSSLCNAFKLTGLFLGNNNLDGFIPGCLLQNLSNLEYLDVSDNHFNGSIPDTFPENCMLKEFYAGGNLIGGPIPKSIGNCKRLETLLLGENKIVDIFPCQLTSVSALSYLSLIDNFLYGDISCIGDWPNLQLMILSSNDFSSFTAFYNSTSMARLKSLFYLTVSSNKLKGTIPSALCSLARMETLDLLGNRLHGTIPACLVKNLTSLRTLNLLGNRISGSIPNEFHDSSEIQHLLLDFNNIEGPLPMSLARCAELEILQLRYNKIRDVFPCYLKNSTKLKALNLRSNYFHGGVECLGSETGGWKSLRIIDISMNELSGGLPPNSFAGWDAAITHSNGNYDGIHHGTLHNQTSTILTNNTMTIDNQTATVIANDTRTLNRTLNYPAGMTVTTKGLDVYLSGTIGVFCSIDFSSNQFNGSIPESIGLLSALNSIILSHNGFSGGIPSSIGNLSNLESLDLSNNSLSGNIPPQFANLRFLQSLDVSMNELEGRIPTGIQMQSFPQSSYKGNKGLCGLPLTNICHENGTWNGVSPPSTSKDEIEWYLESGALGFVVGAGALVLVMVLGKGWRMRYFRMIESLASKFVGK